MFSPRFLPLCPLSDQCRGGCGRERSCLPGSRSCPKAKKSVTIPGVARGQKLPATREQGHVSRRRKVLRRHGAQIGASATFNPKP